MCTASGPRRLLAMSAAVIDPVPADNPAMTETDAPPDATDAEAVIFFCHGSPDPGWRTPFDAILASFRARYPRRRAALCFLERMTPGLPETIDALAADGVERIRVMPLFLAPGAHTRRDLPAMLDEARRRWPALAISAGATLAEDPALQAAIVASAGADGDARAGDDSRVDRPGGDGAARSP